jgi:hypothetical protein
MYEIEDGESSVYVIDHDNIGAADSPLFYAAVEELGDTWEVQETMTLDELKLSTTKEYLPKEIVPCLCTNCGTRNDLTITDGDGHCHKCGKDAWLELRDIRLANDYFWRFLKAQGWGAQAFIDKFVRQPFENFELTKPYE